MASNKKPTPAKERKLNSPVIIEGRVIARTFWGKAWCRHMESMADYTNRLPRGRSYVRSGAVRHLAIKPGKAEAIVRGTRTYTVTIRFKPLPDSQWESIQKACKGKIATLIDILQGKLSKEVMAIVTDPESGLFPKPKEIVYTCTCPDWAIMCKHVAASYYGIANRLDTEPELLFALRQVDPVALFSLDGARGDFETALPTGGTSEAFKDVDLGVLFGITLAGDDSGDTHL